MKWRAGGLPAAEERPSAARDGRQERAEETFAQAGAVADVEDPYHDGCSSTSPAATPQGESPGESLPETDLGRRGGGLAGTGANGTCAAFCH
jgi:hypothetical protein